MTNDLSQNLQKTFPIYAAAFALIYVFSVEQNWALFTYHPKAGEWGWLVQPGRPGTGTRPDPAMYWYGWLATSFIGASAASIAALPLVKRRTPPDWLGWAVPLAVMFAFLYLLRGFFLR